MPIAPETLIELYNRLVLVRTAELRLAALYKEQEMRTPVHFGVGQEAVAVGVCQALNLDDVVFSHHRCHNHYLAKGGDILGLVAELYGRMDGCSGGRGGSVHLTDRKVGLIATSAIVGQMVAVATGAALAFKMDNQRRVAVSFFGDATFEEGILYESVNYAAIHELPVLYVCENNLYSTESHSDVRQAKNTVLSERTRAFGAQTLTVDGNDVVAMYEAGRSAVEAIRNGGGPHLMECHTYRWLEHVGPHFDHDLGRTYRSKEEVEDWMECCPLKVAQKRLLDDGVATVEQLAQIEARIKSELEDVILAAKKSAWPHANNLLDNV